MTLLQSDGKKKWTIAVITIALRERSILNFNKSGYVDKRLAASWKFLRWRGRKLDSSSNVGYHAAQKAWNMLDLVDKNEKKKLQEKVLEAWRHGTVAELLYALSIEPTRDGALLRGLYQHRIRWQIQAAA